MTIFQKGSFLTDLEGLRAIAVLVVLVFHVNESYLPGGFLGVDLFFVISGYVVTKMLVTRGIKGHLLEFYLNRFHRLIPAASTTILFTILLFIFSANQLVDISFYISALSAAFSLSNIHFLMTSGYWSDELSVNPFLHFWSLSAEEQFYLIWPAVLYLLVIKHAKTATFSLMMLTIFGIALLYAIDIMHPSASFYMMPARIFQFAAGALALYLSKERINLNIRQAGFVIGIISFGTFTYLTQGAEVSVFWGMVAPTLAAFLVMCGLQTKISLFMLANSVFRFIGRISYSLYLVHWPIFILIKLNYGNHLMAQLSALVCSFLCAYLLHEKVEKKCRIHLVKSEGNVPIWPKKQSLINSGIFAASAIAVTVGLIISAPEKTSSSDLQMVSSEEREAPNTYLTPKKNVSGAISKSIWSCQTYEIGVQAGNSKYKLMSDLDMHECLKGQVILLGDSWGPEAAEVLFSVYGPDNVATLNSAGCRPLPNYNSSRSPDCTAMNAKRFDLTLLSKYDQIFISSNWANWQKAQVISLLDFLKSTNKSVFLFGMRPVFSIPVPSIVSVQEATAKAIIDLSSYENTDLTTNNNALLTYVSNYENIRLIDWYTPLVKDGVLIAFTPEGNPIYRDKTHLTKYGRQFLTEELVTKIIWK